VRPRGRLSPSLLIRKVLHFLFSRFKTYCIENYAEYKNVSSSSVFEKFLKSKLLQNLKTDYEDLHGMGKEYLMDYFDKWFGEKTDTHHLVKTIYESPVAKLLEDDSMGLCGQSALYLYGLIVEESLFVFTLS
jgi:hypothetical protein